MAGQDRAGQDRAAEGEEAGWGPVPYHDECSLAQSFCSLRCLVDTHILSHTLNTFI